ncbi:PEP/pyruvate-binding domain-containing protein [Pseudonocardia sp. N23]|uniref:PEP/pyruvate-binding domain-containing protein n=1 Tax=Pseudonocardia sp. N23 TaxID=1987376 RepID=UPI000BFB254C|nr:PEP/pyruvate-binding domain-containing protein [Pseudonocardia sp. N23]GAY12658.1 phosphoenolpyruvate synthase [Pseudonocardia sp. N23]
MRYVREFSEIGRGDVDVAGGKGANLGELTRAGFPVPPGFVLGTDAYRVFVDTSGIGSRVLDLATTRDEQAIRALFTGVDVPAAMAEEVRGAYRGIGGGPVAVRSSATAEDLEGASFAGQQDTYLDVRGDDALLAAVRDCWASLWTARAMAYRERQGIAPADVALAVVVQQMVVADAAGVMFTANPTTGRRDETAVSAAWGLGESVVSGAVTTDDVVVSRGAVTARTTADKAVMTVPTGEDTVERPVAGADRRRAVLTDAEAVALAALGARIQDHYGAPQDIEWARAADGFAIVQARPVTALPEPETAPPTDWTVAKGGLYARASIVEQLPDPLTPLFAQLIDPAVTRSLIALMREYLGTDVLADDDIGLPTVNGYAYYRYSRSAMWRVSARTPAALRMLGGRGENGAQARWRDRAHPAYVAAVQAWRGRDLGALSTAELLDGVVALLDAGAVYYTSVQTIIPIAASSEVLLTRFYETFVRRAGDPPAATLLLGFDSEPIRAERSLHDLGTWARGYDTLAATLLSAPADDLLEPSAPPAGVGADVWRDWCTRFRGHLDTYGHTVYNLDFVHAVPADDPAPLVDALRFHLRGEGADPVERQQRSARRRDDLTATVRARLDPARRAVFDRLLRWAQSAAPLREDALADVGLAWPQLRRLLHEIGDRLVAAGAVDVRDDVFWLLREEILGPPQDRSAVVAGRKELWRGRRRATPPGLLPQGTSWDLMERFMPTATTEQTGPVIRGVGASAGQVTAPARVLAGPADFGRMQPGDVLVASITTPAWTSLFAMAAAVVTDVGGPLSHSSIVAREYGIPAVLGTAVATRRITDGERLLVDGDAGTVTLLDAPDAPEDGVTEPGRSPAWPGLAIGGAAVAAVTAAVVALRRRRNRR